MNWLAHLRLSPPEPLLRLGNLAGDFVAGVDLATLPAELQRGIALHRAIDRFVDAHPVVVAAKARLVPPHRRFAGVLLDVWFDHFLARDWAKHGDGRPLPQFLADVHQDLRTHQALLPAPLQRVAPRFCADGWLEGYASVEGIARVLGLMARRVSRPTPLALGGELLRADYAAVERDFAALWPELVAFTAASAPH
ncbi:MAG: ACP phosphodiesterase [Planctomycetota bacterium]